MTKPVHPIDEPCPAAPLRRRWWQRTARRGKHDWYVRWSSPTSSYTQVTPLDVSGMLLSFDSGLRTPRCVIFCERCKAEHVNGQNVTAAAVYALQDAGQPAMAHMVASAAMAHARGDTDGR